jgi:two-component system, chemotaxis family, CheB/CheR fusion protein
VCSEAQRVVRSAAAVPIQPAVVSVPTVATRAASSAARLRPCHILLVEDHADTAAMMTRLLARRGYVVTLATTLAEAREALRSGTFDLLLSDLGLPDGSGLDLMRELASRTPKVPGVALSGYGMPEDARKSLDAGFLEHVTKPVAVERLWATLDRALACAAV